MGLWQTIQVPKLKAELDFLDRRDKFDSNGMNDSSPDKQPKPQSSPSGGPPRPPRKTARGFQDGASGDKPSFGVEHINLSQVQFTSELLHCIPAKMARRHRALPVFKNEVRVGIAIADPSNLNAIDDLNHFLNREVEIFTADEYQLDSFIERFYGNK